MSLFIAADGRLRASWRFFISIIVFVMASVIAEVIAAVVMGSRSDGFDPDYEAVLHTALIPPLLGGFVLLLRSLDRVHERPLSSMGMGLERPWLRETLVGFVFGGALITLGVCAIGAFGNLTFYAQANTPALIKTGVLSWALALAALKEEVVFRGYPFQRLVEGAGRVAAILLLSALFGVAHMANPNVRLVAIINTILIGVMFAVAFLKTRSLWFVWGIHFGWNFLLGVVFGLPVSGIDMSSVVKGEASGHELLTGGSYGIEASLTGTLLGALALLLVARCSDWFVRPAAAINPGKNGIQMTKEA